MAALKRGWIKKVIDGVSTKVFPITHVKSIYYNYTQNKTLADKLNDIDTEIESTKNKVGNISVTKESVTDALGYTPYTPNEIDNKFSALETNIDWKEAVDTYDDIATTYPNPEDGWTVNVKDTDYTYRYNGSEWVTVSANAIPKATNSVDGLLSKEDHVKYEDANTKKHEHPNKDALDNTTASYTTEEKTKLSGIDENANNYTHPTESGFNHIPSGGVAGQILRWASNGTAVWGDENTIGDDDLAHTHELASSAKNGFMSSTDKVKLDGIEDGAQVNQNSISKIIVGSATIASSRETDSLTLTGSNVTLIGDTASKSVQIGITKSNVTDALGYTPYTPNEIDNKFSTLETNIDWKEAVATYDDISTTYPNPEDGWTVNVKDTDYTYRYNGTEWVPISANAIPKATNSVDGLMSKEDYTKVQNLSENMTNHVNATNNPHSLTKEQIGLGNVDNTSDLDKPISTAMQSALDSIVGKIGTTDISSVANTITGAIVALSEASGGDHNHTSLSDVTSIKFAKSNSNYGVVEITPGSNTALSQNILNCPSLFPNASDNYLGLLSNPWYMVASKTLTMVTSTEGYTATLTAETYSNYNNITVAKIIAGCTISPSSTESFTLGDKGNSWKQVYSSELQLFTGTDPYYGSLKGAYESGKGIRIITSASFVPYGSGQTLGTTSEYWSAIYCSRMSNSSETSVIRLLSTGIAMTGDIYPYATAQSNGKLNNPWMFGYFSNFYFVPTGQTEKYATMYGLVENSVVNIYTDSAIIPTSAYSTTTTLGSSSKQWYGVYTSRIYSSGESYGFLFSGGVMVKGDFYPYTSNNYTLGTSSYLFSGIYGSNVYTKAFETDITSDSSVPALVPPDTLNSSYSSKAQVGTQAKPFKRFYASEAYHFTNGTWWNGIRFTESTSVTYGSSGSDTSTGKTLTIGESGLQLLVSTSVASFTCTNGAYFSNGSYSGSDEKIKTFTNDVSDDLSMLVKLFDIIKLRSFKYRYKPDSIIIGVNAEELESDMYSVGLDPSKYGILQIEYDKHLSRGDTEEDDKFYSKFISVSYERLATLAIAKIQDMERTHVDRLNSLEQRLLELEQKG